MEVGMYTSRNFLTKEEFLDALQQGSRISLFSKINGVNPKKDGTEYIEGPWDQKLPHTWFATVRMQHGIIKEVIHGRLNTIEEY
jgi:hypothetical protein